MQIGSKITLEGITKKGKERLRRDGSSNWLILSIVDRVMFSNERGPWLLLKKHKTTNSRWIHETNDKDFKITS